MEYSTVKQDELRAKAHDLGDCGGGTALTLCIEGLTLINRRGDVLDEGNRRLVIEAVAEALNMQVKVAGVVRPDMTGHDIAFAKALALYKAKTAARKEQDHGE